MKPFLANKEPVPCPNRGVIEEATYVLGRQELHVYQLLYFNCLCNPSGHPFAVKRRVQSTPNAWLVAPLDIVPFKRPEYGFSVWGDEPDEAILDKARKLLSVLDKPTLSANACCPLAVRRQCVCVESFECEVHGSLCVGSHD